MTRIIRWYEPEFSPIMSLIEKEAKLANWGNSEGMRVIAKSKFGAKISKFEGSWRRIYVEDEDKFMWLLLRI